jgi:hypothetical protein
MRYNPEARRNRKTGGIILQYRTNSAMGLSQKAGAFQSLDRQAENVEPPLCSSISTKYPENIQ